MNLIDYLDRGAMVAPDRDCLVMHDGSLRLTYAEVQALSHRIAARLRAEGFGTGKHVGIYCPNDPLGFVVVLGVLRAGATWVAMNVKSSPEELKELLEILDCDLMFRHASLAEEAAEVAAALPRLEGVVGMEELESWMAPAGTRVEPLPFDPDHPAILVSTGGTTGRPKGVPLTNRQLHLMSVAFNAHMPEPEPPVFLCATPMTHAAGGATYAVLAVGGTIVVHDGVVVEELLDSIERNRATRIFLPPTALYSLLSHPTVRERDYSSLRHFLIAAAPIATERLIEAVDVFGPVMTQVYGQSEAPFICTFLGPEETAEAVRVPALRRRLESCGRPSLVASVAIMDDDGVLLGPGERGELVVRSDLVMSGYYENPEATAEVRRPGGWHGTGDIGYRDEDGYVYIVDRKKDMIITGGFNVFPSEVEQVIHTFGTVRDCAVIGLPDPKWGEAVTAVIEPKDAAEVDGAAIIAACRERLGPVKTPKSVIVRELPRSPVGKVLKRELREGYWAGQARRV